MRCEQDTCSACSATKLDQRGLWRKEGEEPAGGDARSESDRSQPRSLLRSRRRRLHCALACSVVVGKAAELEPSCCAKKKRWRGRENATPTWVVRVAPIGTVDAPASGVRIRPASWCCQTRREAASSGRLTVLSSKQPRSRRKRIVAVVRSGQHQQCASLLRIESIVLSVTRAEILPRDGAVVCRSAGAYDSRAKSEG